MGRGGGNIITVRGKLILGKCREKIFSVRVDNWKREYLGDVDES